MSREGVKYVREIISVNLSPEIHKKAKLEAVQRGITLKAYVEELIKNDLKKEGKGDDGESGIFRAKQD